jgi:BRCA1-associated protein
MTDCRTRHKSHPDQTLDVSTSSTSSSQQHHRRPLVNGSHARDHYDETLHAYALNTETQHVWDFAGQGYVHRLLQNKEDGKLVEVNDPRNTTSQERSTSPGLTEAQEGEVVHRKLEGFASQYYTLLKSQLEQQRIFYQGRLEEIRREYSDTNKQRRPQSTDLISALKHEKQQLNHRLTSLQSKCRKVKDDVAFLKSMNESLEANRGTMRCQIEQAQRDRSEARKMFEDCLPPLQEKVTRLMLQLENQESNNVDDKPAAM